MVKKLTKEQEIRKKAIYQVIWMEGKDHYSEISERDTIEFDNGRYNNPLEFLENKRSFTFEELDRILSLEEFRKPKDWLGGYIKHKLALFCPETKKFWFSVRYDLFCSEGESLLETMFY